MKKLFISCPMKGRKEEDIMKSYEKMRQIAEAVFGEKLEAIDTFIKNDPPATNSIAIWMLGESIKRMANADYYVGIEYSGRFYRKFKGCVIENEVAEDYDVKRYMIPLEIAAPDAYKMLIEESNEDERPESQD